MNGMKYQWQLFLLALSFFSRIPVSDKLPYSSERMNQSGRYFSLVGLLLGLICAVSYALFSILLPIDISLFLTMVISLMLTGAFHEDGLADMADGIGGGMTVEKRLAIMKDSRIGTYGSSALIMALLGKFLLLSWLFSSSSISPVLVWLIGYASSRAVAISLIFNTPYVSDNGTSKSKPLAEQQSLAELILVALTGFFPLLWLPGTVAFSMVVMLLVLRFVFKQWLVKRLGGFTGDCLGALQQISELIIYLLLTVSIHSLALW
jgi:adenosylcobinamide-GDP ribazoletransferase